jgi:hypothetical protein
VCEIPEAGATELRVHGYAEQPKLAETRPQVAREEILPVDGVGARGHLGGGKFAHRFAQQVDVLAQAEIEVLHGSSSTACTPARSGAYCPTIR